MRLRIPESIRCQIRYHSRGVRDAVQNRGRGVGRPRILFVRSAMHRMDYSYDSQGELVVWEANTLPGAALPQDPRRSYLTGTSHALYAAMARMLAVYAQLPVPDRITDRLADPPASLPRSARAA